MTLAWSAVGAVAFGCAQDITPPLHDPGPPPIPGNVPAPGATARSDPWDDLFNARVLDYNLALRTAALKLVNDLPTLQEIEDVRTATDPATVYTQKIDAYLADPRFSSAMIRYFRNAFRTGGAGHDTAATFAAMLVVQDRPVTDLFTATSGTCPTRDPATGGFAPADCGNGVPSAVGVLTDPGVMAAWYGNLAMRRVRWVQESFVCRKFPTEFSTAPIPKGNGQYTSPWPFESVPDKTTGRIDFRDTSSVICANCHTTMNHMAPLFANFDDTGTLQGTVQVHVPVLGLPAAQRSDWLVAGEGLAWRHGEPVTDLASLGHAIAVDPDVHECLVARVWNWALSKTDIVTDAQTVPDWIVAGLREQLEASGFRLKGVIRSAFLSKDFVRF